MTKNPDSELWAALASAQDRAKAVGKDARNEFARYDYASSEAIIVAANEQLQGSGLSLAPTACEIESFGAEFVLRRRFLLSHSSGQSAELSMDFPVVLGKGKPLDKAYAASLTSSYAYFLRDLLRLPRVDHADDELHHEEPAKAQGKAQAPRQEKAQAPRERSRPLPPIKPDARTEEPESERRRKVAEFEAKMKAGGAKPADSSEDPFEKVFADICRSHPKLGPDSKLDRSIPLVTGGMVGLSFGEASEWQDACHSNYKTIWNQVKRGDINGADWACVVWGVHLHRERAGVAK